MTSHLPERLNAVPWTERSEAASVPRDDNPSTGPTLDAGPGNETLIERPRNFKEQNTTEYPANGSSLSHARADRGNDVHRSPRSVPKERRQRRSGRDRREI